MAKIKDIKEHIEQIKELTHEQVEKDIKIIEKRIDNAVKWFESNDENNPKYEDCVNAFIDLTRKRAALYLRECEPRQINLF